jgi:hypothetical protein
MGAPDFEPTNVWSKLHKQSLGENHMTGGSAKLTNVGASVVGGKIGAKMKLRS